MGKIGGNVIDLRWHILAKSSRLAAVIFIDKNSKVCYNLKTDPCHISHMD